MAAGLSDEELEAEYYDLVYCGLGSQAEAMYDQGYDMQDIIERQKYEKFICQKCDLVAILCEERGIKLWEHMKS